MDLNIVRLLRNRCDGKRGFHVADTGRKVGLLAFTVVNLNGSS